MKLKYPATIFDVYLSDSAQVLIPCSETTLDGCNLKLIHKNNNNKQICSKMLC